MLKERLGIIYEYGNGVVVDFEKALEFYRKGAEAGSTDAMERLGSKYEH